MEEINDRSYVNASQNESKFIDPECYNDDLEEVIIII
jgi:hypothetical protein